ncbi:hypothetical protein [Sansalvadorimonas verongulae]|uniref:hypothetical protein n=1 Tax=Sansalvadorimonas verongulae TaxID=2172824 RepID=UPI0012BCD81F|nr:hypothetical protein [Sansalvadorimonas verongulae]MTI15012.1 hypothetical protein [Sansalvadorimonas verongulae]
MASSIHRHAVIAQMPDERIVANMDVECVISPETPERALDVQVDITQRGGLRTSRHFVLPTGISYNMPHYLHSVLKEAHLDAKNLTSPLTTASGGCSPMVMDFVETIIHKLHNGSEPLGLEKYLHTS